MGRKKKEVEKIPEVKTFEYGDLAVVCKCGRTQIIGKGIQQGIQLVLTNREDSYIQLVCDECGAEIKLCLVEGEKPAETEENTEKVDENVQEENKQEQSL